MMMQTQKHVARCLGFSLLLLGAFSSLSPAIAKPPPPKTHNHLPAQTRQGYDCLRSQRDPLPVAFNPGSALPLTISGHPTFFWYMPHASAGYLEFALAKPIDPDLEREEIVHHVRLPLPETNSIMGYQLPPDSLEALEPGQLYRWSVVLFCRGPGEVNHDLSDGIVTSGWVERLAENDPIALQVANATSDQSDRFAQAGIWHEALTGLATQRLAEPGDRRIWSNWRALLNSVGLGQFAPLPIQLSEPLEE